MAHDPSICDWERLKGNVWRCRRCRRTRKWERAGAPLPRNCKVPGPRANPTDCLHRGEQVRSVECKSCKQSTFTLPIYRCALFGECSIENHAARNPELAELHVCRGCERRQASGVRPASATTPPGLVRKAANFAKAVGRDLANGRKRRSAELVKRIFESHCATCPLFLPAGDGRPGGTCSHTDCGCAVSPEVGDLNKLEWASEKCPDGRWPIHTANLIYYLLPLDHPEKLWQWHVAELRRRLPIFNGRKIITIATPGPGNYLAIEPAQKVIDAFGDDAGSIEFVLRPNDPVHWETPAFRAMLDMLAPVARKEEQLGINSELRGHATFYGHAKGVRRAISAPIVEWCKKMYSHNLDRWEEVREILAAWPCCGIARMGTAPLTIEGGARCAWHYAGTYFWFRNEALFSRPNWQDFSDHSHAVEAYLGTQFPIDDAYCLAYQDAGDVYSPATWVNGALERRSTATRGLPDRRILRIRSDVEEQPSLTIFVLGHEPGRLAAVPEAPHLEKIYLPSIEPDCRLAESRFFLSDAALDCEAEFVGMATASWPDKYGGRPWNGRTWPHCLPLDQLDRLPLDRTSVWCAAITDRETWLEDLDSLFPGVQAVVEDVMSAFGVSTRLRLGPLANNLIAHRDVVRDLTRWMRGAIDYLDKKHGPQWPIEPDPGATWTNRLPAFACEALSILYFANRPDLALKQIPPPLV